MPDCKFGMNDKLVLAKDPKSGTHNSKKCIFSYNIYCRTDLFVCLFVFLFAYLFCRTGIVIDDVAFHQCVKLGKFDTDRTITFVPPDGEFELMRYRTTDHVNLPFKV